MKLEKQPIPKSSEKTIGGIEPIISKIDPIIKKEEDTITILKDLWGEEEVRKKDNKRVTFFVNLIYLLSLGLSVFMIFKGLIAYALPSLAFVTLGVFVFNTFIYNESRRTKQRQEAVSTFYLSYEHQKNNQGRIGSQTPTTG